MADYRYSGDGGASGDAGLGPEGQAGGGDGYDFGGGDGDGAADGFGGDVGGGTARLDGAGSLDTLQDATEGLPHFANAYNRALHAKVQEKKRLVAAVIQETTDHQERLHIMSDHLRNVRQELSHAQELQAARQKEVKSEEHLKSLTERAVGRMRQEISGLDKRADAVADQIAAVQASIFRGGEKLETFRAAMHMAQGELERWAAARREREEDALALDKYTRADELKVRDLSRELEKLTAVVQERRRELEKSAVDAKAQQVEVDKAAADFRALHAERQELISKWKDGLDTIAARDEQIRREAERFAAAKEAVADRRRRIREQERALDSLKAEAEALQEAVYAKERAVGAARDDVRGLQERVQKFGEEVELLKAGVNAAAGELSAKRGRVTAAQAQLEEKHLGLEAARAAFEVQKEQLAAAVAAAATTEGALAEKEAYMARERARVDAAERRLTSLKDQLYKAGEAVRALRGEESALKAEVAGSRRTSKNLSDRIKELDASAQAQQEHVYAAEFRIQQMERKVSQSHF